jgi:hypothetical protein
MGFLMNKCAVVAGRALAGWIWLFRSSLLRPTRTRDHSRYVPQACCGCFWQQRLIGFPNCCQITELHCQMPTRVYSLVNQHKYPRQEDYKKDWLLRHQLARLRSQRMTGHHVTVADLCVAAILLLSQAQFHRNAKPTHQQTSCPSTT